MLIPVQSLGTTRRLIYLSNNTENDQSQGQESHFRLYNEEEFVEASLSLVDVFPQSCWQSQSSLFISEFTTNDNRAHTIWARFRHSKQDCLDFMVGLYFEYHNSAIVPNCCVLVCDRSTLVEDFHHLQGMDRAIGGHDCLI